MIHDTLAGNDDYVFIKDLMLEEKAFWSSNILEYWTWRTCEHCHIKWASIHSRTSTGAWMRWIYQICGIYRICKAQHDKLKWKTEAEPHLVLSQVFLRVKSCFKREYLGTFICWTFFFQLHLGWLSCSTTSLFCSILTAPSGTAVTQSELCRPGGKVYYAVVTSE